MGSEGSVLQIVDFGKGLSKLEVELPLNLGVSTLLFIWNFLVFFALQGLLSSLLKSSGNCNFEDIYENLMDTGGGVS